MTARSHLAPEWNESRSCGVHFSKHSGIRLDSVLGYGPSITSKKESPTNKVLRTSEVATEADVNIETLRYYERRGLLDEPPRLPSGQRQYTSETVRRVRAKANRLRRPLRPHNPNPGAPCHDSRQAQPTVPLVHATLPGTDLTAGVDDGRRDGRRTRRDA
jgi:hypothetical protein